MVDLAGIQAAYYMVAATGVLVAAGYYILNLKVSQKNQELMLKAQQQNTETRQIQILKELNADISDTPDWMRHQNNMMNMKWTDYDDYISKYHSIKDPEGSSYRYRVWRRFNQMGWMVKDGYVDVETFVKYVGDFPPQMWNKFRDVILQQRVDLHFPLWMAGLEYLAGEIDRYRVENGWGLKTEDDNRARVLCDAGD
jgi:hypothetical protein